MTPTQSAAPVLVELDRGGLVESRHRGSLVLLDRDGSVSWTAGEVDVPVFARSALKPLQAGAMVEAGFAGPSASLALAAASHNGEPFHVDGVRQTLAGAGLDESALQCPPDLPWGEAARNAHLAAGGAESRICHNCSGKHAAMLATCVAAGWDTATYLDPAHPLQRLIVDRIEAAGGERIALTSVDGCGAPAHAFGLTALARAFRALVTSGGAADTAVFRAVRAHPQLLGGTGRAVSELIEEVDGLLCKDGAEGVWAGVLADGRAFALKLDDGAARALPPAVGAVLEHWQVGTGNGSAVQRWASTAVLGGGRPVGTMRASIWLRAELGLPPL